MMPYQKDSAAITLQKPVNIFYVWYTELCRRLNANPAPVVKPAKPKCQTVLNFVADRLKIEEWNPVINALKHDTSLHVIAIKSKLGNCQFLHEVDTEEKLRQLKRRSGSLWTAFILKSLLKSISCTVRNTQVLTYLEFDGVPIFCQYLEPLMKALQKNKTLKNLTLSRCAIGDAGCQIVCAYVRFAPNIEILNLSSCGLTSVSGESLAKLIKYQQINRYCESWHNSLRYANPNIQVMRGLKRITVNNNPSIKDCGLSFVLNELDDDLWIKALDMQNCGITENMAGRILDIVKYNQSLEIVDFRLNEELSVATLEKILYILKQKHVDGNSEYQWCGTTISSTCETIDTITTRKTPSVHKTKSAPIRQFDSKLSINEKPVRKTKTVSNIPIKPKKQENNIEEQVIQLNNLLKEEIAKRKETERVNEELKKKLNIYSGITEVEIKPKSEEDQPQTNLSHMLSKLCGANGVKKKNGCRQVNGAYTILEQLVSKNGIKVEKEEERDDIGDSQISLLNYVENLRNLRPKCLNMKKKT